MNINIAYSCDNAYISHTGISMISLFENNKSIDSITIYFIEKNVNTENLDLLRQICNRYNRKIEVISFDILCKGLVLRDTGRHIETIYAKLFLSRLPYLDKIFYIDSDTIVNNSLIELWGIDISNYCLAGVETYTVKSKPKLGLRKNDKFINDGVVLLNLKMLRKGSFDKKFLDYINKNNGDPILLSEGTINVVCKNLIYSLHPKYNLMSGLISYTSNKYFKSEQLGIYYDDVIIKEAIEHPVVIHFLSAFYNRPWDINCDHPMKSEYLYYKSISPWKKDLLTNNKLSFYLRVIKFLIKILPHKLFLFLKNIKSKL